MPNITIAILALLEALQLPLLDESPEEQRERYHTIAEAVAIEATTVEDAAAILTLWRGESRFALSVHQGEPSRWGSDDGKARCMGQLHKNAFIASYWDRLTGISLTSTRYCARATLRMLHAMRRQCRRGWEGAFSGYASGSCEPNKYADRATKMKRVETKLREAMAQ